MSLSVKAVRRLKLLFLILLQTGKFILSDGAEIPNWIYSEGELEVTLPSVEAPLDLVDKKPGMSFEFLVKL